MNEERLLERIDCNHGLDFRQYEFSEAKMIVSITNHIRAMLNVRQGSVMTRCDYGLADINDISTNYREATTVIRASIQSCIATFEPRLQNVDVKHVVNGTNPLELRFDISGDVYFGHSSSKVWLETVMNPIGKVSVR